MRQSKILNEKVALIMGWKQHPDYGHLWRAPEPVTSPFLILPDFSARKTDAKILWDWAMNGPHAKSVQDSLSTSDFENVDPLALCRALSDLVLEPEKTV